MILRIATALTAAALSAAAVCAQRGWAVEAAAGTAVHDPLSSRVGSTTGSATLSYEGTSRWGYASVGAPLGSAGPLWGTAGLGGWIPHRLDGLELGVRFEVDAFGYAAQDSVAAGSGVAARVLPGVALGRGSWRAEAGAGAVGMALAEDDTTAGRVLAEAAGRLIWEAGGGTVLAGSGRYLHGEGRSLAFGGASAEVHLAEFASAWMEAGTWLGRAQPRPRAALGAGAEVRRGRSSAAVAWRQEPADPLFLSVPRRTWSVLVRRDLGPHPGPTARRRDAVVTLRPGSVSFRLPRREHPEAPVLLGDLTGWAPVPLGPDGGWWSLTLPVSPGVHRYVFRTPAGGTWLPPDAPRQSDGFGGFNAILVVP